MLCLINSTVEDVSIKESLGYEAVMGIIDKHIAKEVDWEKFQRLERLGLDEIALKKGHKHYVTIVTTRVGQRTVLLGVLKDRKKETVEAFLRVIPKRLRDTLASAVKLIRTDQVSEQNLTRFEREVQLTSELTSPNTVEIYDFGFSEEAYGRRPPTGPT